jgi:hypothetical protein
VVVDEPQPLHTGGTVAAPVFKCIAEQAVRYLDVPQVEQIALGQGPRLAADHAGWGGPP